MKNVWTITIVLLIIVLIVLLISFLTNVGRSEKANVIYNNSLYSDKTSSFFLQKNVKTVKNIHGLDFTLNDSANNYLTTSASQGTLVIAPKGWYEILNYPTSKFTKINVFILGTITAADPPIESGSLIFSVYVNENQVGKIGISGEIFKHYACFRRCLEAGDVISFRLENAKTITSDLAIEFSKIEITLE
jgi:ABC-type bacteriocin/lantibiotic exporter with double-glycine peptidase domain